MTQDTFNDTTPFGEKTFTNIIATLDPHIDQRLILAAHYDSKFFAEGAFPNNAKFLGATDSALPCALLLDLALTYNEKLQDRKVGHHTCFPFTLHWPPHIISAHIVLLSASL